jgi:hypothetical protein
VMGGVTTGEDVAHAPRTAGRIARRNALEPRASGFIGGESRGRQMS